MIPIGSAKLESAFVTYQEKVKKITNSARNSLAFVRDEFRNHFGNEEQQYLNQVIDCFRDDNFIKYDLDKIKVIAQQIGKPPSRRILTDPSTGKPTTSLPDHIIKALKYKSLRSSFYPKFFSVLGIKACVYCNSQPALSIYKYDYNTGSYGIRAKYQLDHYFPKDDYPFLSICFYNLYPVCGCCNNSKGTIPVNFDLYSDKAAKEYRFELQAGSIASYLLNKNPDEIRIGFVDPEKPNPFIQVKGSFEDTFNLQGIYENQTDIAEELIVKAQIYTQGYKNALIHSFGKLVSNRSLANRIIIGNYTEISETHHRPMAKFTQDIARQLGLI